MRGRKTLRKPQRKLKRKDFRRKTLINVDRTNRETKRKDCNIRCAMRKFGHLGMFTSKINNTDVLKVNNMEQLWWIDSTTCFASRSVDFVFISKYNATVVIKPRREMEEKLERERIRLKRG